MVWPYHVSLSCQQLADNDSKLSMSALSCQQLAEVPPPFGFSGGWASEPQVNLL